MSYNGKGVLQITGSNQVNKYAKTANVVIPGQGLSTASSPSISINGHGQLSSIGLGNLTLGGNVSQHEMDSLFSHRHVKRYEVFESPEDLLVLSVVWHKMRKAGNQVIPRPMNLTDNILFENIEPCDRERAKEIRDYYSKKFMVFTLKEQKLTAFRKDLNSFIHSDGLIFKETMMPLVYRLPEFYEYDIGFDDMVMMNDLDKQFQPTDNFSKTVKLNPLSKLIVKKRAGKFTEYWLKDDSKKMYKIEIPLDNKLAHLWEHFFEQTEVPIHGYYKYSRKDNIDYYHIKNWEIDFTAI
jgi:hypothetical protein